MNKRISYILLPILVLLLSFSSGVDGLILCKQTSELSVTGVLSQNHFPHPFSLTKDDTRQKKNKVRIKAWDDYSAIDVVTPWIQPNKVYNNYKPAFSVYDAHFQSACFSRYNLRGPPESNC